jgi:hypothetical protein
MVARCGYPGRCHSVAQRPAGVLLMQFVGDALVGEAHKLCERRVRPTRTARQRWDETGKRREGMAVERPKIDGLRRVAGRTAHPKNQCFALRAQPMVGENSIGMRLACRSFHAAMRRPASSRIWASVARFAAAVLWRALPPSCGG